MRILLSGATGYIGKQVLQRDEDRIIRKCLVRNFKRTTIRCEQIVIDGLSGKSNFKCAFQDIDAIIHLAGVAHNKESNLDLIFETNTSGTLKLAQDAAINGVKRFVFVSTASINDSQCSFTAQTKSKFEAELGLREIANQTGLEVVIVRPTLVYGSNAPGNFALLARFVKLFPVLPFGLINNKRDFISVHNLADLLLICAVHPEANGHTFVASDGQYVSTKELTNAIAKGLRKKVIQLPIPIWFLRSTGKLLAKKGIVEQLVGDLVVDSSNVQEVLGWVPPYSMEETMNSLSEYNK